MICEVIYNLKNNLKCVQSMAETLHACRHGSSRELRVQHETMAGHFQTRVFQGSRQAARAAGAHSSSPLSGPLAAATLGRAPNCRVWAVPRSSFKILRVLSQAHKAVPPPVRLTEHTPLGYYLEKNFSL